MKTRTEIHYGTQSIGDHAAEGLLRVTIAKSCDCVCTSAGKNLARVIVREITAQNTRTSCHKLGSVVSGLCHQFDILPEVLKISF